MTIAISLTAIPANGPDIQNACFHIILDQSIKIILDIVTEVVQKVGKTKKDTGFGRFITRSVSSLIFIEKYSKTKKLERF